MRKHGLVGSPMILASALVLFLLLVIVTHRHKHLAPAVIRFEPALDRSVEDGQDSAFPAGHGRAPQPAKRRLIRPEMIATAELPWTPICPEA
jgi:hypothetical protein